MPLLLIAVPTSLATTLLVIFGVLPLIFVAWLCCGCKDCCNPGLLLERFRERWSDAEDSLSIYVFFTGVRAPPLAHVRSVKVLKEFDTERCVSALAHHARLLLLVAGGAPGPLAGAPRLRAGLQAALLPADGSARSGPEDLLRAHPWGHLA